MIIISITPKEYSEDLYPDVYKGLELHEIKIKLKGRIELIYL